MVKEEKGWKCFRGKAPSSKGRKEKETHQLLNDLLDQLAKLHLRVRLVEVLDQLGDHLRVRLRLEGEALLFLQKKNNRTALAFLNTSSLSLNPTDQKLLNVLVVGEDAIVDDDKLIAGVGPLRVRVVLAGGAMGGPARVRNAHVHRVLVLEVKVGGRLRRPAPNRLLQRLHLALGADDLNRLVVAVKGDARRVVAAVLQALQPSNQQLQYLPAALRLEVVQIRENACP